jgi:glutaredoxin
MAAKRKVEIFSAGCPTCQEAIEAIKQEACPSCEIIVHDMMNNQIAARTKELGIRSVPAVLIDGKLADCCANRGVDIQTLRDAGLGRAL